MAANSSSASFMKPVKKKSVSWDDDEMRAEDAGSENGVLRTCSSCTNAADAATAGTGLQSAIHKPQSFDHLRVPAKPSASSATVHHHHHGAESAGAGAGLLSSGRRRTGTAESRGIQMGPLRVRTPAKPKRPRPDATPCRAPSSTAASSATYAPHNYLRRGSGTAGAATATVISPKRVSPISTGAVRRSPSPLPRSSSATAITAAGRSSPPLYPGRSPRSTGVSTRSSPRATYTPAATGGGERCSPRHKRLSSSQALRIVAGGDGDDDEAEATFMEGDDEGTIDQIWGAVGDDVSRSSMEEPSPVSLLSTNFSSIGLLSGDNSLGKPPRSPRAGKGSPRSSIGGGSASPRAVRSTGIRSSPFDDAGGRKDVRRMFGEDEDEDEDFPLGVAQKSLDSRLADAAAASRPSMDGAYNSTPSSLSPITTSTTVRRTSTSLINVNGKSSSVVSEEVSEESSFTVTSAACGCQHKQGCPFSALGGHLLAGENANSIEIRDRLKELQGRTSTLEQEKVNLTLALAPLEERLWAKERAWESERRELMVKLEVGLRSTRVAEDRCREVERRKGEMEEERHALDAEIRRLRGAIEQRQSKTAASFWQRTVAADREKTRLETALDQAEAKVATLSKEKSTLEDGLLPIQSENSSLKFRLIEAEKVASRVLTAEEGLRFSERQLEVLKSELAATSAQLTAVQTELAHQKAMARKQLEERERKAGDDMSNLRKEMQRLQEAICSQADRVVAASMSEQSPVVGGVVRAMVTQETESAVALSDAALSSEAARIRQEELTSLRSRLQILQERNTALEQQVEAGEEERRRMHNTILDLSGSVRVYVRARPFLKSDGEDAADQGEAVVRCGADATSIAVLPPDAPNRSISCAFDRVFGGHASQEDVFKEVSGFVQSALDGYKVCLFSYGQTGSGKTHTMTGSGTGMMRGIVPRAVEHILAKVGELQNGPWKYGVQASFLEIYNEELRDLLVGHGGGGGSASSSASPTKLAIKKSASGGTEVAGLTKYDIDTEDREQGLLELADIMRAAQTTRSVACTAMNAESSRSHSVFTLWLTGVDASTGTTLKGVLHLVDLAGSERLDRSGVGNDAQRLRETQAINKSLSCLADVFSALSAKSSHVPYRNSKLTYLMQDCLSGDGKALMFVNLSPTAASANETVCSLRFANQVSQVHLGKAVRQLTLSKPAGSARLTITAGAGPSAGGRLNTPTSRRARASGSASSTAPPSPRNSGSFGFWRSSSASGDGGGGKTSVTGGGCRRPRLSSSSSTTSPPPGAKARAAGGRGVGVGTRSKRTSLTGVSGARARGVVGASGIGPASRAGAGRTSVSGSRLPTFSSARSRVSGDEAGGRRTSGSTRPSSSISKSLPPSPKPPASEKRLRLSAESKERP